MRRLAFTAATFLAVLGCAYLLMWWVFIAPTSTLDPAELNPAGTFFAESFIRAAAIAAAVFVAGMVWGDKR